LAGIFSKQRISKWHSGLAPHPPFLLKPHRESPTFLDAGTRSSCHDSM